MNKYGVRMALIWFNMLILNDMVWCWYDIGMILVWHGTNTYKYQFHWISEFSQHFQTNKCKSTVDPFLLRNLICTSFLLNFFCLDSWVNVVVPFIYCQLLLIKEVQVSFFLSLLTGQIWSQGDISDNDRQAEDHGCKVEGQCPTNNSQQPAELRPALKNPWVLEIQLAILINFGWKKCRAAFFAVASVFISLGQAALANWRWHPCGNPCVPGDEWFVVIPQRESLEHVYVYIHIHIHIHIHIYI